MKAQFPFGGLDNKQVKSEDELPLETAWSEEHECVPLKQRLKMLRAKAASENREDFLISAISPNDNDVKKEDDLCDSLGFHSDEDEDEGRCDGGSCKQSQHGTLHTVESLPIPDRMLSERLEIEYTNGQDNYVTQLLNSEHSSGSDDIKISEEFLEDLDHVVLKERQMMLLSREAVRSIRPAMEHKSSDPSTNSVDIFETYDGNVYTSREALESGASTLKESQNTSNTINKKCFSSALPPFTNVKVESFDDEAHISNKDSLDRLCLGKKISVKSEVANNSEIYEDVIDHMCLGDRMRLLASRKFQKANLYEKCENSSTRTFVPPGNDYTPLVMKRPHKRRKTVTDCIEIALEEDAPGLLQVLIEKGVLVDEIKLYGETEGDGALDESLVEESFSELEDVITKIFSQRPSLFKFTPIRCARGEKASYCLACLISLVEQARYLRIKKWPVEWGWCRDLQSFIFVFEKHNRIVLERPEYGYATYFFELVDALPVHWQVKRLVTAMKLTSCSRITLIENRVLTVGDDITEGEARVLMEYGWIPDSGLGTMLNYRDRVVHDRKINDNESDNTSEWRSKIGKLLADGYNGGTIVPNDIPKKVIQYGVGQTPQIKSEH